MASDAEDGVYDACYPFLCSPDPVLICAVCEQAPASVTCQADAAALCFSCDADIHTANPLARGHHRTPLLLSFPHMDDVSPYLDLDFISAATDTLLPVASPAPTHPMGGLPCHSVLPDGGEKRREREARVMRYREKRKRRRFQKTIRYASRKAYAETRPRIRGRFAKRSEADETEMILDHHQHGIYCSASVLLVEGAVPSF